MSDTHTLTDKLNPGTKILVWGNHPATVVEDNWDRITVRFRDGAETWVEPRKVTLIGQ